MSDRFRLDDFHKGNSCFAYDFFGCHRSSENKFIFRVWAPHAVKVSLIGSFNGWDEEAAEMTRLSDGESFEVEVEAEAGDMYRFCILTSDGRKIYKADPYAFSSGYPKTSFSKICELPERNYPIARQSDKNLPVNIYEVSLLSWKRHKDKSYYSFSELEKTLVPYVKMMGYNYVEFMPVTEFPFDGSWGYQVTGYFSVTARLGTPREFASLIAAFHKNGIKVILDWVPAHFPKDDWGIYEFDGQPLYECPLWDRMEQPGWGTRKFDFGRGEVDSFLLSSAIFFFDVFGVDGLRVDAVSSMLYLDYDRNNDFTPNIYGDNRNLEAIEFVKKLNTTVKDLFPYSIMVAEESAANMKITGDIKDGGLGFDYKWNMGWMNDVLFYCRQDPYYRNYHHNKITFSLMYAFSERFILPLSHDEVVHVKGSIVNKMFGEYADKFAGERILLAFMYGHPGKKLNFMGYEVSQFKEWDYTSGIEFFLTKYEKHKKMQTFAKWLNKFYLENKPLYEIDDGWDGFEWLVVDDKSSNLLAFNRYDRDRNCITVIINFSGVDIRGYGIGLDEGKYSVVLNTDSTVFGGEGKFGKRIYRTKKCTSQGRENSIFVDISRLACLYLKKIK